MKGSADCHLPNDKYREGWERVFGKKNIKRNAETVTAQQFAEIMKNPAFIRINKTTGKIGEKTFFVKEPPENFEWFWEEMVDGIVGSLGFGRGEK